MTFFYFSVRNEFAISAFRFRLFLWNKLIRVDPCVRPSVLCTVRTSVNIWIKRLLLTNYPTDMDQSSDNSSGQQDLMGCAPHPNVLPKRVLKEGFAPNIGILFKNHFLRNRQTDPDQTRHESSGPSPNLNLCSSWSYLPQKGDNGSLPESLVSTKTSP